MVPLSAPTFDTSFRPETAARVDLAPGLARVTAPNASAYTFTGTNSFLIGRERLALVVEDVGRDHRRALGGEPPHGALAHAAGAAGDQADLPRKLQVFLATH